MWHFANVRMSVLREYCCCKISEEVKNVRGVHTRLSDSISPTESISIYVHLRFSFALVSFISLYSHLASLGTIHKQRYKSDANSICTREPNGKNHSYGPNNNWR